MMATGNGPTRVGYQAGSENVLCRDESDLLVAYKRH
jgi:hypothetical protein